MEITNQIQTHILNHLINDEEYCRRVIPFLKKEYFEHEHRVAFDLVVQFVTKHNKIPSGKILELELESLKLESHKARVRARESKVRITQSYTL